MPFSGRKSILTPSCSGEAWMAEREEIGLLDTDVIYDLPLIADEHLPMISAISAVSLAELRARKYGSQDLRANARLKEWLIRIGSVVAPLPFDAEAARCYAAFVALTRSLYLRRQPQQVDLMVAAIATAHNLPLFTSNVTAFEGLKGVMQNFSAPGSTFEDVSMPLEIFFVPVAQNGNENASR